MIRTVGDSDRADLLHLLKLCFSELEDCGAPRFSAGATSLLADLYLRRNEENLLAMLRADGAQMKTMASVLLARIREQPLLHNSRILFIDIAYTLPDRRRRGYMSELCERTFQWAAARGVDSLQLATPPGNAAAIQFWERLGFRATMMEFERDAER